MRFLSNKEKKELQNNLPKGYNFDKKDEITQKNEILFKNKEPFLIKLENKYLPHLKSIDDENYKSVYIDRGAIPFILKGATLMRPGITKIDDKIEKGEIILIKDENHNKNLAIGFSEFTTKELKKQEKGKSVNIFHYFNDEYF